MALYIVATPIGNLKDITLRALEVLRFCPVIIAEKWSDSMKLLKVYDIKPEITLNYDEKNHHRALPKILETLRQQDAAYITSAGTPGVSDPGARLVAACREAGIEIIPIPGPSALTTLLSVSGTSDHFMFTGFLPKKSGQIEKLLLAARDGEYALVFYESTHRLVKTLALIAVKYPEAQLTIGKEMTKQFEHYLTGTPGELLERFASEPKLTKGEFVIIFKA